MQKITSAQLKNDAKENFAAKLIHLKETTGLGQIEIARRLNTNHTYLSGLIHGRRAPGKGITARLDALIKELSKGEPVIANATIPVIKDEVFARKIPVISWATAGRGLDFEDMCRQLEEMIDSDNRDPNAYAVIIEGDSMEPEIRAGDVVTFSPNQTPRNGDYVVARLETGEVFFKRYRRSGPEGRKVILESINPAYAPREFDLKNFQFIHPAWDIKRRLRR